MRFLTDKELEVLEAAPQYRRFGERCPTCDGTGSYTYEGETRECVKSNGVTCDQLLLFRAYTMAGIPQQYHGLDWADYPHDTVRDGLNTYVENFDEFRRHGIGFEVLGRSLGTGKTWAMCHVMKEVVKLGYTAKFTTFLNIKNMVRLGNQEWSDLAREMLSVEFLGIDEILEPTTDRMQAFFEEQLEWVVRQRANDNLPTGTTTNMTEREMQESYPRVYSVLSSKQIRQRIEGEDARTETLRDSLVAMVTKRERRPLT